MTIVLHNGRRRFYVAERAGWHFAIDRATIGVSRGYPTLDEASALCAWLNERALGYPPRVLPWPVE